MKYGLNVPGFENRQLIVDAGGFWSGAKLLIDGKPANKGPKRGQLLLRTNDGTDVIAQFKMTHFIDPIPQVIINGDKYVVAPTLKWYQWLWSGLPLTMIFMGGFLGGLTGAMALVLNSRIFRSNYSNVKKYALSGLVTVCAVGVFLAAVTLFNNVINRVIPNEPKLFTSETGGFSVTTPYQLKETRQTIDTQFGTIEMYSFSADNNGEYISVIYSDYPPEAISSQEPETTLARSRDGFVSSIKGHIVSETQMALKGHPGKMFMVNSTTDNLKEIKIQAHLYLVNNRLYQIVAIVAKDKEYSKEVADFFQSFNVTVHQ